MSENEEGKLEPFEIIHKVAKPGKFSKSESYE